MVWWMRVTLTEMRVAKDSIVKVRISFSFLMGLAFNNIQLVLRQPSHKNDESAMMLPRDAKSKNKRNLLEPASSS